MALEEAVNAGRDNLFDDGETGHNNDDEDEDNEFEADFEHYLV